jgi:hypothetical protein
MKELAASMEFDKFCHCVEGLPSSNKPLER